MDTDQLLERPESRRSLYRSLHHDIPFPSWIRILMHGKRFQQRIAAYAREHPTLFATQVVLTIVSTTLLLAVPILGAAGFSAVGPVAGSAAAGWQAGIGLVEAGSLFAFCQSVAMGGAALGSITAAGAVGAVAAVGAGFATTVSEKVRGWWKW